MNAAPYTLRVTYEDTCRSVACARGPAGFPGRGRDKLLSEKTREREAVKETTFTGSI